jgi:REP element-mobilizing transposase RayT
MPRYRHWQNIGQGGDTVFVTATALGRTAVFATPIAKETMLRCLVTEHRNSGSRLHGYVIMSTHVHFASTLAPSLAVTELVRRLKINGAKAVRPLLGADQLSALAAKRPRTPTSIWDAGFRSKNVLGERMFAEDLTYMHNNPVRSRLCSSAEEYVWSSARLFAEGVWTFETGLPLERVLGPQHPSPARPDRAADGSGA